MAINVQPFFDIASSTFSYVVHAGAGCGCAIIDPVLGFDARSGRTNHHQADLITAYVQRHDLKVDWLLETHAHADHLSAAPLLRTALGGKIAIGQGICEVQKAFDPVFNLGPGFSREGKQFDHLLEPHEVFHIGPLQARALAVPGHTPADMAFMIEKTHVFVGDTLFMPDVGTARCDFPGGDADALYSSVQALLGLPGETLLHVCHDYPPNGRAPQYQATVAEQKTSNIHVRDGISREAFIALRTQRDAGLPLPSLMIPAVQANICAGKLPPKENNGVRYLKIPLDTL